MSPMRFVEKDTTAAFAIGKLFPFVRPSLQLLACFSATFLPTESEVNRHECDAARKGLSVRVKTIQLKTNCSRFH